MQSGDKSPHSIRCRVDSLAIDFKGLLFAQSSVNYAEQWVLKLTDYHAIPTELELN